MVAGSERFDGVYIYIYIYIYTYIYLYINFLLYCIALGTFESMVWCKTDVTPSLTHWSYVFLALTHRNDIYIFYYFLYNVINSLHPSKSATKIYQSYNHYHSCWWLGDTRNAGAVRCKKCNPIGINNSIQLHFWYFSMSNFQRYHEASIKHSKFRNLNVPRLVLQLSLPNPLKPGVKSRMGIFRYFEGILLYCLSSCNGLLVP